MPFGQFAGQGQLAIRPVPAQPGQPASASGGAAPHKARLVRGSAATRARRSLRDLPEAGRKPSKTKRSVSRPDPARATMAAHGPGMTTTGDALLDTKPDQVLSPDRKCRACRRRKPVRCCGLAAAAYQHWRLWSASYVHDSSPGACANPDGSAAAGCGGYPRRPPGRRPPGHRPPAATGRPGCRSGCRPDTRFPDAAWKAGSSCFPARFAVHHVALSLGLRRFCTLIGVRSPRYKACWVKLEAQPVPGGSFMLQLPGLAQTTIGVSAGIRPVFPGGLQREGRLRAARSGKDWIRRRCCGSRSTGPQPGDDVRQPENPMNQDQAAFGFAAACRCAQNSSRLSSVSSSACRACLAGGDLPDRRNVPGRR